MEKQQQIKLIIFIVCVCMLSFSAGLITGIMQGRDIRSHCINSLQYCKNKSVSYGYSNNNIDSSLQIEDYVINLSIE